jgi:endonuclease III
MAALSGNIVVFETIAKKYGTLDRFVESADPHAIAKCLSDVGSKYKLRQVGYTLAMEYLRNVGLRASKPDVHIRRVIGRARLGLVGAETPSEEEAYRAVGKIAGEANVNPIYLDNLLWLFCAKDYGNVCSKKPQCTACRLREACNYGAEHSR